MKVQITIRGRRYTVRSEEDDVDVVAVARYLDERMQELAGRPGAPDEYTVAMLTALNIASDFERYRRSVDIELADLDRDLASASAVLRAALPGQAVEAGEP